MSAKSVLALFKWPARPPAPDTTGLGSSVLALPLADGCAVPAGCGAVLVDRGGRVRRLSAETRVSLADGDSAWCFHPGPYTCELLPFAGAPEVGLRVAFAIDAPDPRVAQQRFDLFLASECAGKVELAAFTRAVQDALQRELAQGNLDLPPCTTLDEWNAFRAGFNQLLYTRFGVTVDDCVPVDLADSRDYARELMARAASASSDAVLSTAAAAPAERFDPVCADARALRRLFLELPCVMCALRLAVLPGGQALFRQHQALLQRLDLVSLAVGSMPALELAAPNQPLEADQQLRRARHSVRAVAALDEAWALLARLERAGEDELARLFDETDRIVANLEHECNGRRVVRAQEEPA